MKTIPFLTFFFLTISLFSQKEITIDYEVDEFTGDTTISSNWFYLNDPIWKNSPLSYVRLSKFQGEYIFELKAVTPGSAFSVDEGDQFMMKLENDYIVVLKNINYTLSGIGRGSIKNRASSLPGVHLFFKISKRDLIELSENKVVISRLTTNDGKLDIEFEKEKYADMFLKNCWVFASTMRLL